MHSWGGNVCGLCETTVVLDQKVFFFHLTIQEQNKVPSDPNVWRQSYHPASVSLCSSASMFTSFRTLSPEEFHHSLSLFHTRARQLANSVLPFDNVENHEVFMKLIYMHTFMLCVLFLFVCFVSVATFSNAVNQLGGLCDVYWVITHTICSNKGTLESLLRFTWSLK